MTKNKNSTTLTGCNRRYMFLNQSGSPYSATTSVNSLWSHETSNREENFPFFSEKSLCALFEKGHNHFIPQPIPMLSCKKCARSPRLKKVAHIVPHKTKTNTITQI